MTPTRLAAALSSLLMLLASPALAAEGKWTPEQLLQIDSKTLKALGLKLPPSKLWDPKTGEGLLAAATGLAGCSAGFISNTGLFVTNHHCLYGILQQHSSAGRDLIETGVLARTPKDELYGQAERLYVPRRFVDVTKEVLAAVPAGADDLARFRAVDLKQKELEQACHKPPDLRCEIKAYDDGRRFTQIETIALQDIRLVYAPPSAVGEFGGEIDNWSWPRHTGDFAIGRAYVAPDGSPRAYDAGNVPYRPKHFLPLSTEGVKPGDFVAVLGYPGATYRSLVAAELEDRAKRGYGKLLDRLLAWIAILEDVSKQDDASRIAVASTLKSLHNSAKNVRGQLEGFERRKLLEKHAAREEEILRWAKGQPKWSGAVAARDELAKLIDAKQATYDRDLLLGSLRPNSTTPSKALWLALNVVRIAKEKQRPAQDRDPELLDRDLPRIYEKIAREQRSLSPAAERRSLAWYAERSQALPQGQPLLGLDARTEVERLLTQTRVLDAEERKKMVSETPEQLAARKDPLLELGFKLAEAYDLMRLEEFKYRGAAYRLRPVWLDAAEAFARSPLAPDANGTLRISFGQVKGYAPKDGLLAAPQTTLSGLLAKDTGKDPFHVPQKLKDAAARASKSRWIDPRLKDVPVDFLADLDTTGGNSGSPVIDGNGRLVGVNFDRVWENVTNDFGYDPAIARNISADVRYLLWHLEEVEGATELLRELGVGTKGTSGGK